MKNGKTVMCAKSVVIQTFAAAKLPFRGVAPVANMMNRQQRTPFFTGAKSNLRRLSGLPTPCAAHPKFRVGSYHANLKNDK